MPLLDEHVSAVGREVRDFARLHWLLAREEVMQGSKHFLVSLFLLAFGVTTGALVLVAAGAALFLWLQTVVQTPAAAGLVALVFLAIACGAWWLGWRRLKASGSIFLPQTRRMLWELISCRDEATNSSKPSGPDDRV